MKLAKFERYVERKRSKLENRIEKLDAKINEVFRYEEYLCNRFTEFRAFLAGKGLRGRLEAMEASLEGGSDDES